MAWYFDVISDSFWLSFVFFVIIVVVFFSGYSVPFVLRLTSTNLFIFCICQTVPIVFSHCEVFWTLSELDNPVTSETWIESKLKLFLILYFISSK